MRLILVQPALSHRDDADNRAAVERAIDDAGIAPAADDVVLLPERWHLGHDRGGYEREVRALSARLGCTVVGGSHHEIDGEDRVHRGVAIDAAGAALGRYEKLRPYALERGAVRPGTTLGEFSIAGRRVLLMICADFWFLDLLSRVSVQPDLILVPALSVSRKPTPEYSRTLWRHLAVARAYELGAYVGISDWASASDLPSLSASGVAGLADPTTTDPTSLFQDLGERSARAFPLDFAALDAFRDDRRARGFFWRPEDR